MKYQIAEQQIVQSDFYRNLDTTAIAKVSTATCPHKHVVDTVHAVLTRYASKLAVGEISIDEVKVKFAASVYSRVAANA